MDRVWMLVLGVAACGAPPRTAREPTPGVPHFRIMTYNVWAEREASLETVGQPDADIVCLQEVSAGWEQSLRERYSDRYPHMLFRPDEGAGGLAVLSRYPVTDGGFHLEPHEWHPAWHVVAQTPAGPVQLLAVHLRALLDSGGDGPLTAALNVSADHRGEIDQFTSACAEGLTTIVLGDFNEGPEGDAIRFLERQGFDNALPLYHPGQETWYGRSVAGQLAEDVDHILYDGTLDSLNAWVVRAGSSDHLPVVADLEVRQTD